MAFAHDTVAALQAAVELANSAEPPDTLTTTAQLEAFSARSRYTGARVGDRVNGGADQKARRADGPER